jgi:hypothetical protein
MRLSVGFSGKKSFADCANVSLNFVSMRRDPMLIQSNL